MVLSRSPARTSSFDLAAENRVWAVTVSGCYSAYSFYEAYGVYQVLDGLYSLYRAYEAFQTLNPKP